LAAKGGVGFTSLSRIENEKLESGDLICKFAKVLEANPDELIFLANRLPDRMKHRMLEWPDLFHKLAELSDEALDAVPVQIDEAPTNQNWAQRM
jgi:hypothetical protein